MLLIKWCLTESLEALHDSKRHEHTDKHESQNQGSDDIVTLTHPTVCSCSFGDQKSPWGLQPVRMWPSFNSLDTGEYCLLRSCHSFEGAQLSDVNISAVNTWFVMGKVHHLHTIHSLFHIVYWTMLHSTLRSFSYSFL